MKFTLFWFCFFLLPLELLAATSEFQRQDIEFTTPDKVTLRGWLYTPQRSKSKKSPVVVMAHGYAAVKEMWLDKYAEVFAKSGLSVLVYDHRNFGASDGKPRQEIDPWAQVRDYRHAITFARTLEAIDAERVGVGGSSYSGGHALVVGALDRRVKAVVAQVPATDMYGAFIRNVPEEFVPFLLASLDEERKAQFSGAPANSIPVVSNDPEGMAALGGAESFRWFTETAALRAPAWKNEVTVNTVDMSFEYQPWSFVQRISPTPLLMIVAERDNLSPTDLALKTYQQALEPKQLRIIPGGHFDAYTVNFEESSSSARDWYLEHL